jgi:hypothetical protein
MSGTYTPPDYAALIAQCDQVIAAKISGCDISNYSIANRSVGNRSLLEVMEIRERFLALYNEEQAGGNVALADQSSRRGY